MDKTSKLLGEKVTEMGSSAPARDAKGEVKKLESKLSDTKHSLGKALSQLDRERQKAAKKADALKKLAKRQAEFSQASGGKDKLGRDDIVKFSKSEYDFALEDEMQ